MSSFNIPVTNNLTCEDHANYQYDSLKFTGDVLIHMHGAMYTPPRAEVSVKNLSNHLLFYWSGFQKCARLLTE